MTQTEPKRSLAEYLTVGEAAVFLGVSPWTLRNWDKSGKLKSGRSGKKVKSRKQAIAIGLSQARRRGAKVPKKRTSAKRSTRKTSHRSSKRTSRKK